MLSFHLFRIKVYPPEQPSLFAERFSPQLVLAATVSKKPSLELRRGYTWHVGNVRQLDSTGMYFAFGRTTRQTIELYDLESGDFVERQFEAAPYTHVICDTALEVCGVAAKYQLAATVDGIARQLERVLTAESSRVGEGRFEVAPINDPEEFISQLLEAHSISRFALTFSLPNPFDVNEQFQRPMERLLREAHGSKGKTSLTGADLSEEVLVELTRSAAATGNDAEATIRRSSDSAAVRKRLRGNVASLAEEELETDEERRTVLQNLRLLYRRIRGV